MVDTKKLQAYVEGKKELGKIFPGFIEQVGKEVEAVLRPEFPGVQPWLGPTGTRKILEYNPDMKEPIYLDWVCFGFEGHQPNVAHVGVLFDLDNWPFTCRIGIHALEDVWVGCADQVKAKQKELEENMIYEEQKAYKEHQLNDPRRVLDLGNLDAELEGIVRRVCFLYRTYNPIVKKA